MYRRVIVLVLSWSLFLSGTGNALTADEERKGGREAFLEVSSSVNLYHDPFVSFYLDGIKRRLEEVANLPFPVTLTVIESSELNAFATMGGFVYVTTGLIQSCEREDELAGVMAHELAHVGRRHIAKRMEKQKGINAAMVAAILLSSVIGGPAGSALLAGGIGGAQTLALKHSRDDEDEADRSGAAIAEKAGYSVSGISDFLRRLRTGMEKAYPQYLLTHPYPEERLKRLESLGLQSRTKVDVSFFPFLPPRVTLSQNPPKHGVQEIFLGRYERKKDDPVSAYGAVLVYMSKGEPGRSLAILDTMKSKHTKEFAGEVLVSARKFPEAIRDLREETAPWARFILAKAYEGSGNADMAVETLLELVSYGSILPEIYYRLGMLMGRAGRDAQGHEYLGRYYFELGRLKTAQLNLEKAISRYGINSPEASRLIPLVDEIKKYPAYL